MELQRFEYDITDWVNDIYPKLNFAPIFYTCIYGVYVYWFHLWYFFTYGIVGHIGMYVNTLDSG